MASPVATDLIDQIADRYAFRGDDVPEALAAAGPEVAALLLAAADEIAVVFGPEPTLVLENFIFLDEDEEPGKLYALIQTTLDPAEMAPIMTKWLREWWLQEWLRVRDRLNIDVEYV